MKRTKTTRYSINAFWDKRCMDKQTKDSRIMMIINLNGHQFKITLNMRSSKSDFEKAILSTSTRNLSDEVKQLREVWNEYALKAELILTRLSNPTQEIFTKFFKSETDLYMNNSRNSIIPYFKMKEERLFKENRFSSSSSYRLALSSLLKFNQVKYHNSIINFEDIDARFLNGYVAWMQSLGNSIATPSMYLRNLRSIYNDSIKDSVIAESCYPFKHFK
ncbi:MAG TPA: phage integrase SAM-like domain-containing protein, partial [Ginsengibacter sp.]